MNSKRNLLRLAGTALLAPVAAQAAAPSLRRRSSMASYFPNVTLETHDGRKVKLYDDLIRDKLVAFNMMYSICEGICPKNTANLRQVHEELGPRVGRDIFLYSITLRPEFDNAAALRDYIRHYNIKPGWTFLTGRRQDVERVRVALGFVGDDAKTDADITQHTGMLRIGNDRLDRWTMTPALGSHRQIKRTLLELT